MGREPTNRDDPTPEGALERDESIGRTADRPTEPTVCANCTAHVDTSEWHPIATKSDDDRLQIHAFCDSDCRDEWVEEN